jgi:hypothetical protein
VSDTESKKVTVEIHGKVKKPGGTANKKSIVTTQLVREKSAELADFSTV